VYTWVRAHMRMCTSYEYVCALLVGVCNPVHTYAGEYACDTRGREGTHEHMCWGVCAGVSDVYKGCDYMQV
jgi:hypothetical protein